jgi:hypothetical protein
MAAMLKEIASDTQYIKGGDKYSGFSSVSCYMGSLHVSPISRTWHTSKIDKLTTNVGSHKALLQSRTRGSSNAEPKLREIPFKTSTKSDYI